MYHDVLERTETILKAVIEFIDQNPVSDYTVVYDEAECDGGCLQDDARVLLDEIQAIRKTTKALEVSVG